MDGTNFKFLDDFTLGRYLPGRSSVHRIDPRVKLVGLPLLMVATFAAPGYERLACLTVLAAGLAGLSQIPWKFWWRGIRLLRWLLLFSLLLHLLFSPGRTLFGTSWLSLDGLLLGIRVCWQLVLAVLFASTLSLTTSPAEVAAALSHLLAPLKRIGLAADRIGELLFLVMQFIPLLRAEAVAVMTEDPETLRRMSHGTLLDRGRTLGRIAEPLVLRLADRADELSHRLARGEPLVETFSLGPISAAAGGYFTIGGGILVLGLLFLLS